VLVTCWPGVGDEAFSSIADAWSFPFAVPCCPTLAMPLVASIYYSLILKLLISVEMGQLRSKGKPRQWVMGKPARLVFVVPLIPGVLLCTPPCVCRE